MRESSVASCAQVCFHKCLDRFLGLEQLPLPWHFPREGDWECVSVSECLCLHHSYSDLCIFFLGRQRNCSDFLMRLCQFVDQTWQSKIKDADVVSQRKTANNTRLSTQIYIRYILLKFQDDFPLLLVLETKEANQFLSLLSVEPNALKLWQWDNSITPGYT